MRIWDVNPELLCRQHLLGLHREIHAVMGILKKDSAQHLRKIPEVRRWVDAEIALVQRHEVVVEEMKQRGWHGHKTPLRGDFSGWWEQQRFVIPLDEQISLLRGRCEECNVRFRERALVPRSVSAAIYYKLR